MNDHHLMTASQGSKIAEAEKKRCRLIGGERRLLPDLATAGPNHLDWDVTRNEIWFESWRNRQAYLVLSSIDLPPMDQVIEAADDFPGKTLNAGDRLTQEPSIDDDPAHVNGRRDVAQPSSR
jgi:hypothetical protein